MSYSSGSRSTRVLLRIAVLIFVIIIVATLSFIGLIAWKRSTAEEFAAQGRWRDALAAAESLLAIHPRDRVGNAVAVRALTRMNRPVDAERFRARARTLSLTDLHLLANGLLRAGKGDDAAEVYREITQRWPDDLIGLKRLAALELANNQWDQAETLAFRLIAIPEGEVAGRTLAGSIYYHMGRSGIVAMFGMSVNEFQNVVRLDPQLRSMPLPRKLFWNQYAYSLIREGRAPEARLLLESALNNEGDDAELLALVGQTHLIAGEVESAERVWKRAMQVNPRLSDPWLALGQQVMKKGAFTEALPLLERAAELAPDLPEALYALALAYRHQGRSVDAVRIQTRLDALKRH